MSAPFAALGVLGLAGVVAVALWALPTAYAATPPVGLGTTSSFAVLAGSTVTNTGPSTIDGDLGVAPGLAVTGFPPGTLNGAQHAGDAVALQAKLDLGTAYDDAAKRPRDVDQTGVDLGGLTLTPGVYNASSEMALTGTVVLDARGDPDAVFVFQAGSTLITGSDSVVSLTGAAQPCNVYWQVGTSATLGTGTRFVGTVMALASATLQTKATLQGRVLARNGQVSLDTNTITRPACATGGGPTGPSATPTPAPTSSPAVTASTAPTKSGNRPAKAGGSGKQSKATKGSQSKGTKGSQSEATKGSQGQSSSSAGDAGSGDSAGASGSGGVVPFGRPDTGRAPTPPTR